MELIRSYLMITDILTHLCHSKILKCFVSCL